MNDKPYRPPFGRNEHVNVVFTRSGLTYDPPVNPNAKTTIIHDDSEDKADEAEKERLHKEKMEERYANFIELIKEVRINVPLVDVLAGMPNYGKFLKDLGSNKSKMEQISATFLNEECSAIVQNKLPPKLGDLGSFLIPCTLAGSVEHLALADLDASINLMPYSLYASLSGNTLKPTRMSIRLANHTYQYPMGIAKNMLVQVGKFVRITEEELDALLDDSKPFTTTSEKIIESFLDHEFEEFMAVEIKEIHEQEEAFENSFKVLPLEGNQRIKNSIQDPPTDLVMKPPPEHLEYAFLEKDSLLPLVISSLLQDDEKKRLVSVFKKHKEAFA
ncbi:reverse transcriptase domain-containing protein [Tanacetum coccineum]|uniref:Reverse transcriptase domain-containing protein n=1 Tax=Tanacetum coccineum TaxID=301880 RepID=A0ABQ5GQD6_9ASTR